MDEQIEQIKNIKKTCTPLEGNGMMCSGYLVAPQWVATAGHFGKHLGHGGRAWVRFSSYEGIKATVMDFDERADCALLRLDDPIEGVEPAAMADRYVRPKESWVAFGFPAVSRDKGVLLEGTIQDPNSTNPQGAHAIQLFSEQIKEKDTILDGLSGAPIVADGCVIGHQTRKIPKPMPEPGGAAMGIAYACPIQYMRHMLTVQQDRVTIDTERVRVLKLTKQQQRLTIEKQKVRFVRSVAVGVALLSLLALFILYFWNRKQQEAVRRETKTRLMKTADVVASQGDFLGAMWQAVSALEPEYQPSPSEQVRLAHFADNVPHLVGMLHHDHPVRTAAFLPGGSSHDLVTTTLDGAVAFWRVGNDAPDTQSGGRHEDAVTSLALSENGLYVVTGSRDGTARVWDAATGQAVGGVLKHENVVNSVAFSRDGRRVITASSDKTAKIWESATGEGIAILEHDSWVVCADLDAKGEHALTACGDTTAWLWEVPGASKLRAFEHDKDVRVARFSPDGALVLTAGDDRTARIWDTDARAGQPARTVLEHDSGVIRARFSRDGTKVITLCENGRSWIWAVASGRSIRGRVGNGAEVRDARFADDGRRAVIAGGVNSTRVISTSGDRPGESLLHPEGVWEARFSADGSRVVTACMDGTARIWRIAGERRVRLSPPNLDEPISVRVGQFDYIGERVVACVTPEEVWEWRRDGAADSWTVRPAGLRGARGVLTACYGGRHSEHLVSTHTDGTVRIWDVMGDGSAKRFDHPGGVFSAVLSPDGSTLVTAGQDVLLWGADSGTRAVLVSRPSPTVTTAGFTSDGSLIAIGTRNGMIRFFDVDTRRETLTALELKSPLSELRFGPAPTSRLLLTSCADRRVRIWDMAQSVTSEPIAMIPHGTSVKTAAFLSDERFVLTATADGDINVWESATGKHVTRVIHWPELIASATLSQDGRRLFVVDAGMGNDAWILELPPPLPDLVAAKQLRTWAEWLSGVTMDKLSVMRARSYREWQVAQSRK